jgi:histidine triad (HIT) family protein
MDFYCDQVLPGYVTVERLAETENVLAFHHTQPYWPVHIVVIPKTHISSLAEMKPRDFSIVQEMLSVAAGLCQKVVSEHGGCRLSTNCGDHQSNKHLHFYIHSGKRLRDEQGVPIPSA